MEALMYMAAPRITTGDGNSSEKAELSLVSSSLSCLYSISYFGRAGNRKALTILEFGLLGLGSAIGASPHPQDSPQMICWCHTGVLIYRWGIGELCTLWLVMATSTAGHLFCAHLPLQQMSLFPDGDGERELSWCSMHGGGVSGLECCIRLSVFLYSTAFIDVCLFCTHAFITGKWKLQVHDC